MKKRSKAKAKPLPSILKLNLGSGNTPIKGYVNLDRKSGQEIYPLDYPDNSADEIRASHVLEHFSHKQTMDVLTEWLRVLKPGGVMKIAVPNLELICALVNAGTDVNAQGYLMGGHVDGDDHHGAIFDQRMISAMFYELGLEQVRFWPGDNADCSTLPISLNMQATKPLVPKGTLDFKGVIGVAPMPRYGVTEHHACNYNALAVLNLKLRSVTGCFYNQHWCNGVADAIAEDDCKYVLSFDYDSVYSTQDVIELYRIMETHPHIDALVPVQSGRGENKEMPLFTVCDKQGNPVTEAPTSWFEHLTWPIATGHFGLTLLRAESMRRFPKPWMLSVPDENGLFGPNRVDPDIYFWQEFRKHGFNAQLACRVVIGHIEECIFWPGKDMKRIIQRMGDYRKNGKPMEAK